MNNVQTAVNAIRNMNNDELDTIKELKRVKRLLDVGNVNEAWQLVDLMIERREEKVSQFELEMQEGMNA